MYSGLKLFILLTLHVTLQYAEAGCPEKYFLALKKLSYKPAGVNFAVEANQQLAQARKLKEETLKPIFESAQEAYKKGQEQTKLRYEMMDLKRVSNPDKTQLDRMAEIETKFQELSKEITEINNKYINDMHAIYAKEGIPSQIVAQSDGALVLKLDFSAPPTKRTAYEFYRRVQSRFGLNQVTLSLKENAELGFAGFFSPQAKRIEMGPQQGFSMLEDYFNTVSKHESRHSMFAHKREIGDDSIFHTQFYASSNGNLLNSDKMYDTYMSSEELYTYSTDMQSLAQAFTRDIITDIPEKRALLQQIFSQNENFKSIANSSKNITSEMIKSLDEIDKSINPYEKISIQKNNDGKLNLNFKDKLNRQTTITMVSQEEKQLAQNFSQAQANLSQFLDQYVTLNFEKAGMNLQDFLSRASQNKLTAEEVATIQNFAKEGLATPNGKQLIVELNQAARPMIKNARENMDALNRLAEIQLKESEKLKTMLSDLAAKKDNILDKDLELLKHQMFTTSKNVKEDYRGFALKPQPSGKP